MSELEKKFYEYLNLGYWHIDTRKRVAHDLAEIAEKVSDMYTDVAEDYALLQIKYEHLEKEHKEGKFIEETALAICNDRVLKLQKENTELKKQVSDLLVGYNKVCKDRAELKKKLELIDVRTK